MLDGRVRRGQATRQRLMIAARELFGERGYDGTSIEAVLDRTGVARGALYHHFRSKETLFDAVVEQVVIDIANAAADAARTACDPVDRLRAGCGAWLEMALDPAVQRVALLDPPAVLGWTRWRQLDERYTLGGIKAGLRTIAASGQGLAGDLDILAHMLLAAVNEVALMIAGAEDPRAALQAGRAAVDALIEGLVTGPASDS